MEYLYIAVLLLLLKDLNISSATAYVLLFLCKFHRSDATRCIATLHNMNLCHKKLCQPKIVDELTDFDLS